MCGGTIYYVRNIIAPKQRGTTMCDGKKYVMQGILYVAPKQRGTTMCAGKKYNMQGIL